MPALARASLLALVGSVAGFGQYAETTDHTAQFFVNFATCMISNSVPCLWNTGLYCHDSTFYIREHGMSAEEGTSTKVGIAGAYDFFCSFWSRFSSPTLVLGDDAEGSILVQTNVANTQQIFYSYELATRGITEETITWTLDPVTGCALTIMIAYNGAPLIKQGEEGYFCEDPSTVDGYENFLAGDCSAFDNGC